LTDSSWFFLYTPIPYLIVMYLAAYRRDLGRIARRIHDRASKREWWSICEYLGLVGTDVREPARRPWRSPLFLAVLLTFLISFSWTVIFVRFSWYYLCLLQTVAALPLLLLLIRITGPLPFRPYRDVLPFPRLGSRIRHLKKLKEAETTP
jgi:hypothetical protein